MKSWVSLLKLDAYKQTCEMNRKMFFLSGQKKITLKADDLGPLLARAIELDLPRSTYGDELLVIGPAANADVDKVTGHLKLYS